LLIVSEMGDIHRFPSAKKLCSYAGLVPRVHSSGGKTRHGPSTKQGSKWLRWILVETSVHYVKAVVSSAFMMQPSADTGKTPPG
jgi:transposase